MSVSNHRTAGLDPSTEPYTHNLTRLSDAHTGRGMDNSRQPGDVNRMQMFRSLMSLLMILIMLPWGAYAGNGSPPNTSALYDLSTSQNVLNAPMQTPTEVSTNRNCRTMTLPGSHCGPDRVLPAVAASYPKRSVSAQWVPHADWHIKGRQYAPPRDPPRFF